MNNLARNQQGIALIAALSLMAVGAAVMMLLFMRTIDELQHGRDDTAIVQTLLVAQGGANIGISLLHADVREQLDDVASFRSDSTGSWSFGSSPSPDRMPTAASVASDLQTVASDLQPRIDAIVCGDRDFGTNSVLNLRIYVTNTACGLPLPPDTRLGDGHFVSGNRREYGGNQMYALPFVMVADGQVGEFRRRIVTQGEYQFEVGRRSFARYALFTDTHSAAGSSGRIWFTSDTLFDGPVHTNGNFNFYGRPWFGGPVTSAGQNNSGQRGAYAYDGGSGNFRTASSLEPGGNFPNMDQGSYENRPQFTGGVDWRSDYLALPDNAHDQRQLADDNGIRITREIRTLELYAADADGNRLPPNSTAPAAYQYVQTEVRYGSNWRTEYHRISPSGVLEHRPYGGSWGVVTNNFNGVIYVDDEIERLTGPGRTNSNDADTARPAIASFSQLTIVPAAGARITGDLVYQDQPCEGHLHRVGNNVNRPVCENLDAVNVLGIFSPEGDIQIGHNNSSSSDNAPSNVRIQASLLTSNGIVEVEDYNQGSARGAVQLLGGIIEREYGAFGTFSSSTGSMSTGYSRQFTFDPRLSRGLTPPYFPTVGQDGVSDIRTFTFGHREQVYSD